MPAQVDPDLPESAPRIDDRGSHGADFDYRSHSDPEAPHEHSETNEVNQTADTNMSKTQPKKRNSDKTLTAKDVMESERYSQDPGMWSSPFRALSKSIIGFFITIMIIARIRSKSPENAETESTTSNIASVATRKKKKQNRKQVRILDMSGNLSIPSEDRYRYNNDDAVATPDTVDSGESATKAKNGVRVNLDDTRFEDPTTSQQIFCKVFVVSSFVVIAGVLVIILVKWI